MSSGGMRQAAQTKKAVRHGFTKSHHEFSAPKISGGKSAVNPCLTKWFELLAACRVRYIGLPRVSKFPYGKSGV